MTRLGTIKFEGSRGDLIAFRGDGRTLVISSRGTAVKLWDVATGRESGSIECGHQSIWASALAPDGAAIATVGFDGGVRLHALDSGKETFAIPVQGSMKAVAFSPDATLLAYAGVSERQVHLVDAVTGQPRRSFAIDNGTKQIGFSPDGRTIAVEILGAIVLHDVASGKEGLKIPGDILGSRFAWSRDGKALARVDYRGSLRIVNPTTGGDLVPALDLGSTEEGRAIAFSPDGSLVAVGVAHPVEGPALFLVDTKTGEKKAIGVEKSAIDAVGFSPDGSVLATVNVRGIRLWSVPDGHDLSRTGHEASVETLAFSADGGTLATASADAIYLWRTVDWKLAGRVDPGAGSERAHRPPLTFAADGSLAAVVGRTVVFADPVTGEPRRRVRWEREHAVVTALAPGAFVKGTDEPEVVRFDLENGSVVWSATPGVWRIGGELKGVVTLANMVTALAVTPDGKTIAAAFSSGEIILLDAGNGRQVRALSGKGEGKALSASFAPDGRTLVTQAIDRLPQLWDVATGDLRCAVGAGKPIITGASFSRDGKLLAASEPDGSISFFDVATCAGLGQVGRGPRPPTIDYPQALAFGPTDAFLVSGHLDHTVRVWALAR